AAPAPGAGFDETRPAAGAGPRDGPADCAAHCVDVVTVDGLTGDAVAGCPRRDRAADVGRRRLRDRPAVVLAHDHDRQPPGRSEVERFVNVASIGGTVAERADADAIG